MTIETTKNEKKVTTDIARAGFVSVFSPRKNQNSGNEEYSLQLLIAKSDRKTINKITKAIQQAKEDKFGQRAVPKLRNPLRDGDDPNDLPSKAEVGAEPYAGHFFMNVKSNVDNPPGVVNLKLEKIIDPSEFASGDYCRVSMNAYAYDNVSQGVSFGLLNVQVIKKGKPIGGTRSRPEDDFEVYEPEEDSDNDDFLS
jgi:hypothetical protein